MLITQMKQFRDWLEDAWWSWGNCINFRFVNYNDNIDRLAFFEELNVGWYREYIYPYDDEYLPTISKERRLRLSQEPYTFFISEEDYNFLVKMIKNPEPPSEALLELFQRKIPWEELT